jgi:hypothetical protein
MARELMAPAVLRRRLATAFETNLTDIHLDRLAILAGIHDLGKALKGFQDKLERTPLTSRGHVAEALAVLMATLRRRFNCRFCCNGSSAFPMQCMFLFATTASQ